MRAWLRSDAVRTSDGGVLSWCNAEGSGYRYPEVAGLWLSAWAWLSPGPDALRDDVARGLIADVTDDGGVGRAGHTYAFDTAMALAGLLAHERAGGSVASPGVVERLFAHVAAAIAARRAASPEITADPERWSASFGAHQLKLALCLGAYEDARRDPRAGALGDELVLTLRSLERDGRFRIHARSTLSYLHAHCYAMEGLAFWSERRADQALRGTVRRCAEWLASVQTPAGGLPAWHDGSRAWGACHADVAAQAVRLWACVDRAHFAGSIDRALGFLASLQSDDGGVRYHPNSQDVNTWSTIFAVQAVRFAQDGGRPAWIV